MAMRRFQPVSGVFLQTDEHFATTELNFGHAKNRICRQWQSSAQFARSMAMANVHLPIEARLTPNSILLTTTMPNVPTLLNFLYRQEPSLPIIARCRTADFLFVICRADDEAHRLLNYRIYGNYEGPHQNRPSEVYVVERAASTLSCVACGNCGHTGGRNTIHSHLAEGGHESLLGRGLYLGGSDGKR